MSEEKKDKIKVPEDVKGYIKAMHEKTKIPVETLLSRLREIIETDEKIQAMENNDFKVRFAWAKLGTEISSTGKTDEFFLMPTLTPSSREITSKKTKEKMHVGDLTALVQKISKDDDGKEIMGDVELASGTFWREGAKSINGLSTKKVYRVSLVSKKNEWGYEITTNRTTSFLEVDHKMPMTVQEFYDKEIKPLNKEITVGEMDLNKGEFTTDVRVIRVTAMDADVGERDGREFGYYDIADLTNMGENKRIFVHPDDVEWNQGSVILMTGRVDIDDDTEEVRWNPFLVLPDGDLAQKRMIEVKPVSGGKETIDVSGEESAEEGTDDKKEDTKEQPKEEKKEVKEESDDLEI